MKTFRNHRLSVFVGLLSVAASAIAAFAADGGAGKRQTVTAADQTPEAALKWAMPSAAVREVMGQPDEIRSLPAPKGKAEVWVFRRPVSRRVDRVVVGAVPIMSTTYQVNGSCREKRPGRAIDQKIGETLLYANLFVTTVEKVEVLLFNEHFVTSKVTRGEERSYN